ncbi:MAG: SPOR domain-containing protein [Deltaproteobacteria bacterium]|nr:SPOR domain-containing protein [Deltaproteobacteria bacterium]
MNAKNIRTFELKLGKRSLIVFVLSISCLLFVTFLLGIQVGKLMDAHPEKVAKGVPYVIMECFGWSPKNAETLAAVNEAPKENVPVGEDKMDLTFFDTLGKKKSEKPSQQTALAPPPSKETLVKPSKETSVKPSPVTGNYQIQVVSLKEKEKADQLCKKLMNLGYSPRIVTAELRDRGVWHRVVLEGYESREQAQKVTDIVSKKISGVNCVIHKKNN